MGKANNSVPNWLNIPSLYGFLFRDSDCILNFSIKVISNFSSYKKEREKFVFFLSVVYFWFL